MDNGPEKLSDKEKEEEPVNLDQLKVFIEKLPFDLDLSWMKAMNASTTVKTVREMFDVANVVYSNIQEMAQLVFELSI